MNTGSDVVGLPFAANWKPQSRQRFDSRACSTPYSNIRQETLA